MNFQVFHVNPGKKLKKKDVNNDLSHFMSVFPKVETGLLQIDPAHRWNFSQTFFEKIKIKK